MKKINTILLITITISLFSCKKETTSTNTGNTNQTSVENFKKLKYVSEKNDTIFLNYTDNKIKEIITPDSTYDIIWIYESGGYFIKRKFSNFENNFLVHCKLNSNNIVSIIYTPKDTIYFNYLNGFLNSTSTLKYNLLKYISRVEGNISKSIYGNDTLNYEYLDEKNRGFWKVLGLQMGEIFDEDSHVGFTTGSEIKNLLKNIKNNNNQIIKEFEYEFDNDGYVSKLTIKYYSYHLGIQSGSYSRVIHYGWY